MCKPLIMPFVIFNIELIQILSEEKKVELDQSLFRI